VSRRFEPVSGAAAAGLATPLSMLHAICFPQEPWTPQAMAKIMAIAGFFGRIAWEDDRPVGFALALDLGGEFEILSLGVVPQQRRRGTGSALLAAIGEEAGRRGGDRVFLEVAADNTAARALYSAAGYVQIARRSHYYRRPSGTVDALVLRATIGCSRVST
jgi:[ribosomal protein S18]-alanine N-acetyltransferase